MSLLTGPTTQERLNLINQKLIDLTRQLQQICKTCGTPGASIGIIYQGDTLPLINIGNSNVQKGVPVGSDTIFSIGSLTKTFIATAIAVLVQEKKMQWDTPLKDLLPGFRPQDNYLREHGTVIDLLAHRTGMSFDVMEASQGDGASLLPYAQITRIANSLTPIHSLREQFLCNCWGYSLAGLIIERHTEDFPIFSARSCLYALGWA